MITFFVLEVPDCISEMTNIFLYIKIQRFSARYLKKSEPLNRLRLRINLFVTFTGRFAGIKCLIYRTIYLKLNISTA